VVRRVKSLVAAPRVFTLIPAEGAPALSDPHPRVLDLPRRSPVDPQISLSSQVTRSTRFSDSQLPGTIADGLCLSPVINRLSAEQVRFPGRRNQFVWPGRKPGWPDKDFFNKGSTSSERKCKCDLPIERKLLGVKGDMMRGQWKGRYAGSGGNRHVSLRFVLDKLILGYPHYESAPSSYIKYLPSTF
jgi:hypothetical protein